MMRTAGGRARHRLADIHAVEQGFPRGDRCERQRRGLGKSERARLVPDNALVDEMKLGVGARADIAARIEAVARPEERSLRPHLDDDARILREITRPNGGAYARTLISLPWTILQ